MGTVIQSSDLASLFEVTPNSLRHCVTVCPGYLLNSTSTCSLSDLIVTQHVACPVPGVSGLRAAPHPAVPGRPPRLLELPAQTLLLPHLPRPARGQHQVQ